MYMQVQISACHGDRVTITTGILLFDGAEELDYAGPWEVLTMARRSREERVVTIAESLDPVRSAKGLRVLADHTLADAPPLDVLIVPGGKGTRREVDNAALTGWVAEVAKTATWVTSVCTGSFVLQAAGLTEGKKITTHWAAIDELRERAPEQAIDAEARWVVDGNLVTAAGVSAGIDMALWLVGQLYDIDHARFVQRAMQYDPAPPYQD